MAEQSKQAWRLISVLFSTVPLTASLAGALLEAARALWSSGDGSTAVAGDTLSGRVRSLRKDVILGAISGPAFEADLETERGSAKVSFLVARTALGDAAPPRRAAKALLN